MRLQTFLMCLPCEVLRTPGRIQHKEWGWKDISACKEYKEHDTEHVFSLLIWMWISAIFLPPMVFVAGALTVIKGFNMIKSKLMRGHW